MKKTFDELGLLHVFAAEPAEIGEDECEAQVFLVAKDDAGHVWFAEDIQEGPTDMPAEAFASVCATAFQDDESICEELDWQEPLDIPQ
jgi:hypothetical protein